MEIDDVKGKQDEKEDIDYVWIYGLLVGYGKFMDYLVMLLFILFLFIKYLFV